VTISIDTSKAYYAGGEELLATAELSFHATRALLALERTPYLS